MTDDNSNRIKELQEEREKIREKIEKLDAIFLEEKDNEEAWPGHSSTKYQTADTDRQVLLELLRGVEEEIKGINLPKE